MMAAKLQPFTDADWTEWSGAEASQGHQPLIARIAGSAGTRMTVIVDDDGVYVSEEAGEDVYAVGLTTRGSRGKDERIAATVVAQLEAEVARGCDVPVIYGLLKLGFVAL